MTNPTESFTYNSPIKMIGSIFNEPTGNVDEDALYERLQFILSTLHTERQQFEERVNAEKKILKDKINQQSQNILQLQSKIDQLQQQTRQLRFNYHQRGAVVDYLKKKVHIIEKKFDSEKEEMLSIVKYLQSRNSQLNEIIFELKNKQAELNQHIFELQEKFINVTNQYCNQNLSIDYAYRKSTDEKSRKSNPKLNTKRTNVSQTFQNSQIFTPMSVPQLQKYEKNTSFSRQKHLSNLFLDDLNNDSLVESSIKEKTLKYQNSLARVRSEDQIDFAQLNHIINLGGKTIKHANNTEIQHFPGKGILINNFGHMTFGDYQPQPRQSGIINKQKKHYLSRPKLSLPNNSRYPSQLNSRRTSKDILISHEL